MTRVTATLISEGWLDMGLDSGSSPERRRLSEADFERFRSWTRQYHLVVGKPDQSARLLEMGCEMLGWLDGDQSLLQRTVNTVLEPPLVIEFRVGREPKAEEVAFLEAPWELLADAGGHWGIRETVVYCAVRRMGTPTKGPVASPHLLCALFMAASPEGLMDREQLNYEAEERAIQRATEKTSLDLIVDESGHSKKGNSSVGVARQYNGRLGKVDNCQVGVFAALAAGARVTLLEGRLYLPEVWCEDAARCDKVKVPADKREFKTKSQMALEMVRTQRARRPLQLGEHGWRLRQGSGALAGSGCRW